MTIMEASDKLQQDASEMETLLKEISQGARTARTCIENLIDHVKSAPPTEGISFLDMKNRLLTSYSSNLGLLMLRKCYGKELEGEQAIERMIEIRTVLEKVRPIDHKLRYQVDKLVNIAESGTLDKDDPLRFKPNPSGLLSKLEEDSSDEEGGKEGGKDGIFKPPRNVPQFYNTGATEDREEAEGEKRKKHIISKSIMDSIKEQYLDTPEEISHKADVMRKKLIEDDSRKVQMEEEHFTRFNTTKEEKANRRRVITSGNLGDDIISFGRNVYDDKDGSSAGQGKGKKRKGGPGGGKGKGKAKKSKFKRRM